ncbi:uncharacterized protein EV420DRAFT_1768280 [Desarmillaria tabescens]|uniref:Uncharacterized protein n=1 Tax=Armillaria tabescens TaxID=1929756 RepID=A0AA39MRM8_ARMTA|nr:uncharacterized protein EV420DRAFT_1768280 [Desarmillaria tabescens]KAK0444541.1 hypothetical protein EV420DRAFT_1768280 [Desarmillaria tabescens]
MRLNIYIALYNTDGGEGKYRWALVTRDPQRKLSEPVSLYQVVKKKKWETNHDCGARLSAPLLCLIEMPSLEANPKEVDTFIRQQPAAQGSSVLLRGQKGWSSAHWVIRTLEGMAELRWFEESVGDHTDFYDYIANVKGKNFEQGVAAGPEFAHAYGAHMGIEVDGIRPRLEEKEHATAAIRKHLEFRMHRANRDHTSIDKVLVEQHLCDARREWIKIVGRQKKIIWDWKTEADIKKRLDLTRQNMMKTKMETVRDKMSSAAIYAARTSACIIPPRPPPPKFVPGLIPSLPPAILVIPNPIAMFSCSPRTIRGYFEKAMELAIAYQEEYCGLNRTKARQKAEGKFLEDMSAIEFDARPKTPVKPNAVVPSARPATSNTDEEWEINVKRCLNETYKRMVSDQEKELEGVDEEDKRRLMAEFKERAMASLRQTFDEECSRRVAVQHRD